MKYVIQPKEELLSSLKKVINVELARAISLIEYPAPIQDAIQLHKFVHVRMSEYNGKSRTKYYWRNQLVLAMEIPCFTAGGKRLEAKFVRFLENGKIVAKRFEYDIANQKVRMLTDFDAKRAGWTDNDVKRLGIRH